MALGGIIYHVLNRANGRMPLFESSDDYEAFLRVFAQAHRQVPMRTLSYSVMPNHWHMVLWPNGDKDLSEFMHWLTTTHTHRWLAARGIDGFGHVYKGRFKSIPVEDDEHYLTVCRYVERNACRAGLVARAEDWRWSSLWQRRPSDSETRPPLCEGPLSLPEDWLALVNECEPEKPLQSLRRCITRGRPFGHDPWVEKMAQVLKLESTLRPRGRPKKVPGTFFAKT
jgi:putative transposase